MVTSNQDLKTLLGGTNLTSGQRDNVTNYFNNLEKGNFINWWKVEKELTEAFGDEKLRVIKDYRKNLSERGKLAFANSMYKILDQGEVLNGIKSFNHQEFNQFIDGICTGIKSAELSINENEIEKKRVKIDDYFKNPNEGFAKKFKRGLAKSVDKLSDFLQDFTGIDPKNPLDSLKKKFGGDKKEDKSPTSDSKAVDDFIPSPVTAYGMLYAFNAMGFTSFAAAFAPAAVLILAAVKVKGIISSDEKKEGTIHNPIRSRKSDYTEPATKSVTHDTYGSQIKNQRGQSNKSPGR